MEEMIFDRTHGDVEYARKNPYSTEFLKGSLNYIDLNRIEKKYIEISQKLELLGKYIVITPVKTFFANIYLDITETYESYMNMTYEELLNEDNWNMKDLILIEKINQIRENIQKLQQNTNISISNKIEFTNHLNYKQLNILEKILYEIDKSIEQLLRTFVYCGTFYCGEETIAY